MVYAVAAVIVLTVIVSNLKGSEESEHDAIQKANSVSKDGMKPKDKASQIKSFKFEDMSAESLRNGIFYQISSYVIVGVKDVWTTYYNRRTWDYYDVKRKYQFAYILSFYDGEWTVEGRNRIGLGTINEICNMDAAKNLPKQRIML